MVINEEENDYLYCTICQKTVPYEHAFEIDTSGDNNTDGNLECPTCHEMRVGHPEFQLCTKCQDSIDMQDVIYDNNSGFGYCKRCYGWVVRDTFVVNEHITLKLRGIKTIIYIDGKEITQCKYLLLNIPKAEAQDEKCVSIDEFGNKYSRILELNTSNAKKQGISPETEFWGHCSNLQAWVENDYNPNILHSNLALPLLTRLCTKDIRIFNSLLFHLDEMWNAYKTYDRKMFVMATYEELIRECFGRYGIAKEDMENSTFIRAIHFRHLFILVDKFRNFMYEYVEYGLARGERIVLEIADDYYHKFWWSKEVDRNGMGNTEWLKFQKRRNKWEKKIYGSNLRYRRWLRHLRNRDVSIESNEEGYLAYVWSIRNCNGNRYYNGWDKLKEKGISKIRSIYLSEGIEYVKYLEWTYQFCNGWNGSHCLNRYAVRYKDGTLAIRHLVL